MHQLLSAASLGPAGLVAPRWPPSPVNADLRSRFSDTSPSTYSARPGVSSGLPHGRWNYKGRTRPCPSNSSARLPGFVRLPALVLRLALALVDQQAGSARR